MELSRPTSLCSRKRPCWLIGKEATRPLITRTDSGGSTVNVALLAGYAGASAISYTYYPQINKNVHDTAATYGSTLEGAAIGFLASEFSAEIFQALHLAKKP